MKKSLILLLCSFCISLQAFSYNPHWQFTGMKELNMFNKLLPTETQFFRFDTEKVGEVTEREYYQCRQCSGLAISFKTDSKVIGCKVTFAHFDDPNNTTTNAKRGFDLYVKKNGEWVWAGTAGANKEVDVEQQFFIAQDLSPEMKECILYFPLYSEISSFSLATSEGAAVERGETPFTGRICVFGSSYTQGSGCSRSGMTYTAQLSRMTGYNFINMGFSGRSKLQAYFAHALCKAENVDAYVFDAFSNPGPELIRDNLFPFIEIFQQEKPGVPLIFMKTCFREFRQTHPAVEAKEAAKMAMADSLMKIAVKKYDNVYYVDSTCSIGEYHETTTDGTHPDQHGYTLWAESVRKPIVKILREYGIGTSPTLKMACIGDSITYGSGIKDKKWDTYPARLQALLGSNYAVTNYGIGGRVMMQKGDAPFMKEKYYQDVKDSEPDIVTIMLGTNDSKPHNWQYGEDFVKDCTTMVDELSALPSKPVIFLCLPPWVAAQRISINDSTIVASIIPDILKVAKEKGLVVIDTHSTLLDQPETLLDGVHPTVEGDAKLAETIAATLAECGYTRKPLKRSACLRKYRRYAELQD